MFKKGKFIKSIAYLIVFSIFINGFSSFTQGQIVFAKEVEENNVALEEDVATFLTEEAEEEEIPVVEETEEEEILVAEEYEEAEIEEVVLIPMTSNTFMTQNTSAALTGSSKEIFQVASGNKHSLVIKGDGTVWAWGVNEKGQLGDGTKSDRRTPVQVSGLTDVIQVAAGNDHSMALKSDGTVWTWGKNDKGQLGNGATSDQTIPVQISGLTDVYAIAGGNSHSLALKSDGTVWAWGDNGKSQLGDDTSSQRTTPVQVLKGVTESPDAFLQNIVAITAGKEHSVALKADGTVYAWGNGGNGMLGNGATSSYKTPVKVSHLTGISTISAKGEHTIALKEDGTVWGWGKNDKGQLGDGSTTNRNVPVQVTGLSGIKLAEAGNNFSVVLKEDGTVWTWGNNEKGQLGDGTTQQKNTPVQVLKGMSESGTIYLEDVKMLALGNNHVLGVKPNQTLWAWGDNGDGRLGDGTSTNRTTPVFIQITIESDNAELSNIILGEAQLIPAFDAKTKGYSVEVLYEKDTIEVTAILADANASMKINGMNQNSAVAKEIALTVGINEVVIEVIAEDGITQNTYIIEINRLDQHVAVPGAPQNVTAVAGSGHAIISFEPPVEDGGSGIIGYTVTSSPENIKITGSESPIILTGLTNGVSYTFTVTASNRIGEGDSSEASNTVIPLPNSNAELKSMSITRGNLSPVFESDTTIYEAVVSQRISSINLLVETMDTGAVLKIDGNPISSQIPYLLELDTGENVFLIQVTAEDTVTQKNYALTIIRSEEDLESPDDVLQLVAGNKHSLVLKGDGTVWAWGVNEKGQLGDGTKSDSRTPVQATGLTDVIQVAAGNDHSIALKSDGTVWAWGKNEKGQVGNGSTSDQTMPVQVSGLTDVYAIAGGNSHSLALKNDGTVWAWGDNGKSQLGDNTSSQRTTPVQVLKGDTISPDAFLRDIAAIAAGKEHSVALKEDGTVYAWGNGENGMLGNGGTSSYKTPVKVSHLTGISTISAKGEHTIALKEDGTVWGWGKNDKGQLGDGSTTNRNVPVQVAGLSDIKLAEAGNNFSAVLKEDGTVWTWGNNEKGQLGDGTTQQKNTPVQVLKGMSESTNEYLQEVRLITTGNNHVLAVKIDETVWAWGDNGDGRLGDGTSTNQTSPVQIALTGSDVFPELPEEPLEDDYLIESYYWLSDDLLAFQINLGFSLLSNVTDLLSPDYIRPEKPNEEPEELDEEPDEEPSEEPSEEPEETVEEPESPPQGGDTSSGSSNSSNEVLVPLSNGQLITSLDRGTYTESRINTQILKETLQKATNKDHISLEIPTNYGRAELTLESEALKILRENKTSAVVVAEGISYSIPYYFSALEQLVSEKGNVKELKVTIEKVPLTATYSKNYKLLIEPVAFKLQAVFANEVVEIKQFKDQYIERRIVLKGKIDPKKAVGVVWENNSWNAVPTTFSEENGVTIAIIKRNGNSIYAVIENEKTFEDINSHWAKHNIELLASKNIVSGMDDRRFEPNSQITRGQFVTMLMRSIGYKEDGIISSPLKDVSYESWYGKYVYTAMSLGIVTGYEDNTFKPNKEITREEMAAIIRKTIELIKEVEKKPNTASIGDKNQISPWAADSIDTVIAAGIMGGYEDQTFRPKNKATRAEAVTVFKNMMTYLDFITY